MIEEYSGFYLAIRVGRRRKDKDVVAVLKELNSLPPAPAYIQSDNGPFLDELLNSELCTMAPEAQILADRWRGQ